MVWGKIGGIAGILGVVGILTWDIRNFGEEIYRGKVDGYDVIYEEGRVGGRSLRENRITIQKDGSEYVFEDCADKTDIDWKRGEKPSFEKDSLDEITIRMGNSKRSYSRIDNWGHAIDNSTIEGEVVKKVFDQSDVLYNDLRTKIREELRSRYLLEQKPFLESLEIIEKK